MVDVRHPLFYAVELDTFAPVISSTSTAPGRGGRPHGVAYVSSAPASSNTVKASNVGYRTAPTDAGGVVAYPPLLADAFAIDRKVNLDPTASAVAAAWGTISLSNANGALTALAASTNSDGRGVRIYAGQKTWDAARGIWLDPAYTALTPLFLGIATPWFINTATLDVPIRDATYWMERSLQSVSFGGTGGYDGTTDLTGLPKPKTRGQVLNITPVLIDAINRIYQYNDGPGTVSAVSEGGDQTHIVFQSDVADLYTGSTNSGFYRTCNARGMFQLGATPQAQITADVTGAFPVAGVQSTAASIAAYMLLEDMAVPAAYVDAASFAAVEAAHSYAAGVYFGPTVVDGATAVDQVIGSVGWKLIPLRSGALSLFVLKDVTGAVPIASLDVSNAVSVTPAALPTNVAPPAFRFRVGYNHNYTVMTSGVAVSVTDMTRKSFLATADAYAAWSSTTVLSLYRRPNDPTPIPGVLTNVTNAQTVANMLGALWGVARSLYSVVVPATVGIQREIGDVVRLTWPNSLLANGAIGQIVGEQFRSADSTSTLMVLV